FISSFGEKIRESLCWDDAGCLILDTRYPGMYRGLDPETSSVQYPASRNISNDFNQNSLIARKHLCNLRVNSGYKTYLPEQNIDQLFLSSSVAVCKVKGEGGGLSRESNERSITSTFSWFKSNKLMFEKT
ncbi:MAG: hypothetical protein JSW26_24005, partial [Desulfobacterales bacterium]